MFERARAIFFGYRVSIASNYENIIYLKPSRESPRKSRSFLMQILLNFT